jgi:hypothetical protein
VKVEGGLWTRELAQDRFLMAVITEKLKDGEYSPWGWFQFHAVIIILVYSETKDKICCTQSCPKPGTQSRQQKQLQ